MRRKNLLKKSVSITAAAGISAMSVVTVAQADLYQTGVLGDLNNDGKSNVADLVIMTQHLNSQKKLTDENMYRVDYSYIGTKGEALQGERFFSTADMNTDGKIDIYDLIMLKEYVSNLFSESVREWFEDEEIPQETTVSTEMTTVSSETETTTVATVSYIVDSFTEEIPEETAPPETTMTVSVTDDNSFISPPVNDVLRNIPSQGDSEVVIFYVDFPNCKYSAELSAEQIDEIAFGAENTNDSNYPFESISAFYSRASKGVSSVKGKTFRYTAKENIEEYEDDKGKLLKECYKAFENQVDFSQFDGDKNGFIDATLINVPAVSDTDIWWPSAGSSSLKAFKVDNMKIGHVITGNSEIAGLCDYTEFVRIYSHELAHGMGLPDYYEYLESEDSDFEGLHGLAGIELMDDALSDFGAVSKLHLGWYRKNQVNVYDYSKGTQTYTLKSSQTENGNCLIIPCGELDSKYKSEYFVIEYNTNEANNSYIRDNWYNYGNGIRIYHVDAEIYDNGYWTAYKYESGNGFYSGEEGRRFIRITDDFADYDNYYHTGDIIDSSVQGFCFYDESGNETVDAKVRVIIGELTENGYEITVENT